MQKLREFFSQKKLVSNDSELPNSARNSKKNFVGKFFWKLQVSNAKTKVISFNKKKLLSNDSELSNSARNGKKNSCDDGWNMAKK